MKLVLIYMGPGRADRGMTLELLPRFAVHVYPDDGYVAAAWLLWACELQWKYAR